MRISLLNTPLPKLYTFRHKIPDVAGPGRSQYLQRKRSQLNCRAFINDDVNKHWVEIFESLKKKDDLADTIMQALSFVNRVEPTSTKRRKR